MNDSIKFQHIRKAVKDDLPGVLELQKLAFYPISLLVGDSQLQPMVQTYGQLLKEFDEGIILCYIQDNQILGSVRAHIDKENICHIGKLIVHLKYQNKGIGKVLMSKIEEEFLICKKYCLFTGEITPNTLYLYNKLGYTEIARTSEKTPMIIMEKLNEYKYIKQVW